MSEPKHATWTVIGQVQRTKADASGNVQDGYEINFTTGEGHPGTLFLPMTRYTVANVKAGIQTLADQLDLVGALNSDS